MPDTLSWTRLETVQNSGRQDQPLGDHYGPRQDLKLPIRVPQCPQTLATRGCPENNRPHQDNNPAGFLPLSQTRQNKACPQSKPSQDSLAPGKALKLRPRNQASCAAIDFFLPDHKGRSRPPQKKGVASEDQTPQGRMRV